MPQFSNLGKKKNHTQKRSIARLTSILVQWKREGKKKKKEIIIITKCKKGQIRELVKNHVWQDVALEEEEDFEALQAQWQMTIKSLIVTQKLQHV